MAEKQMLAARLHGPGDVRVDRVDRPGKPEAGQVRIKVTAVGVCGSDLHAYQDGRIGDTQVASALCLGHEFAGVIEAVGQGARGGAGEQLEVSQRVAVDPAQPCGRCELCLHGHPNLCEHHAFCGVWPADGALREAMIVPADTCFALPEGIDDEQGALLEPLGVALHAVDLAHIRVGQSVAVLGAGPIGLYIAEVAKLAGATPLLVTDRLPWRLALVERLSDAQTCNVQTQEPAAWARQATDGRGVDVVIEAAWSGDSIAQALDIIRPGGRLVVVGIAGDDQLHMKHSTARRKGVTIVMCRRMKHTYPRAIALTAAGKVDLSGAVTHRLGLAETARAFEMASSYAEGVGKVVILPQDDGQRA